MRSTGIESRSMKETNMKNTLLFPVAAAMILAGIAGARADFTIAGEPDALVVEARDAQRSEVVAGIVERFGIEATGEPIQAGAVTGHFSGSLRQVLEAIAPGNGYAVAYADGRPARITFTVNEAAAAPQAAPGDDAARAAAPVAAPTASLPAGEDGAPSVERILRRDVRSGTAPAAPETAGNKPKAEPEADIGEMTRRARAELEELAKAIRQTQP